MNYNDTCAGDGKAYYCKCYGRLNGDKPTVCSSFSNFFGVYFEKIRVFKAGDLPE